MIGELIDEGLVDRLWPTVRRGLDLVTAMQLSSGAISWALRPDGTATGGEIFLARPGSGGLLAVRIDGLTAAVDLDEGRS